MQYKHIHSVPITQYTYYFIYTSTAGDVCFFFLIIWVGGSMQ